jgi:hypothetical protein
LQGEPQGRMLQNSIKDCLIVKDFTTPTPPSAKGRDMPKQGSAQLNKKASGHTTSFRAKYIALLLSRSFVARMLKFRFFSQGLRPGLPIFRSYGATMC